MKVKFKKAWSMYYQGEVIDTPGSLATWLIDEGVAERVADQSPKPKTPEVKRKKK